MKPYVCCKMCSKPDDKTILNRDIAGTREIIHDHKVLANMLAWLKPFMIKTF